MRKKTGNILKVLLFGLIVGIVLSILGGWLIASPQQIAGRFSIAFLVAGAISGNSIGTNLKERTFYGTVGALGSVLGWVLYRVFVL